MNICIGGHRRPAVSARLSACRRDASVERRTRGQGLLSVDPVCRQPERLARTIKIMAARSRYASGRRA